MFQKNFLSLIFILISNCILAQSGPENGSVILIGGGAIPPDVMGIFVSELGGYDKALVVIPTSFNILKLT